jgi:hypothetical protein
MRGMSAVGPGMAVRGRARDCLNSRDTCICDIPIFAAIWVWVM